MNLHDTGDQILVYNYVPNRGIECLLMRELDRYGIACLYTDEHDVCCFGTLVRHDFTSLTNKINDIEAKEPL